VESKDKRLWKGEAYRYFDDFSEAVKARKAAEMHLQYHENHGASDRAAF
jgi:hypothetical protein